MASRWTKSLRNLKQDKTRQLSYEALAKPYLICSSTAQG